MALGTFTQNTRGKQGYGAPHALVDLSFAGDSSYPTGGTAGFQAAVRAKLSGAAITVLAVMAIDCKGYQVAYDPDNDKLKFYQGDNDNGADGPAVEVPNATNLSSVTFRVLVIGA